MLQNIRDNAQGTIAKIIVGLIILTFAVFGTDAIIQSFYGEPEAAEVNGEPITQVEYERLVERRQRQLFNQMGPEFDPATIDQNALRRAALDEAIQRRLLLQAAERLGVTISDAQIDAFILQWPAAQQDGEFDPERFRGLLASLGMTPNAFRAELRQELAVAQIQSGISQSAFLTEAELLELLKLERQTRSFRFVRLSAEERAETVEVTEEEIRQRYEDKLETYRVPDRVVLRYIEIQKDQLAADLEIPEEELEAGYQSELAAFESSEQRSASHILVEIDEDMAEEQALTRIRELREEILGGRDFAEVAEAESDDLGTRIDGGQLGVLTPGVLDDVALEKAIFEAEEGELSEPVKSAYGYHLVKVSSIQKTEPPSREEIYERLRGEMLASRAETAFVDASTRLADMTYSAEDLTEASEEMSLTIQTSPELTREGIAGHEIWSHPKVLEQAFGIDVIEEDHNSEVIEVSRDRLVVFRKDMFKPTEIPPLEELTSQIRAAVALEKAKAGLVEEVDSLLADPASEAWSALEWTSVIDGARSAQTHPLATGYAFSMPAPGEEPTRQSFELAEGYMLVEVTAVTLPETETLQQMMGTLMPVIGSRIGSLEYELFLGELQNQAEILRSPR